MKLPMTPQDFLNVPRPSYAFLGIPKIYEFLDSAFETLTSYDFLSLPKPSMDFLRLPMINEFVILHSKLRLPWTSQDFLSLPRIS